MTEVGREGVMKKVGYRNATASSNPVEKMEERMSLTAGVTAVGCEGFRREIVFRDEFKNLFRRRKGRMSAGISTRPERKKMM